MYYYYFFVHYVHDECDITLKLLWSIVSHTCHVCLAFLSLTFPIPHSTLLF